MRKGIVATFALVGVLALAPAAFAQDVCQLVDGVANLEPGFTGDSLDQTVDFTFEGDLATCLNGNSGGRSCAIGTATGGCPQNTHEANYVICSGECVFEDEDENTLDEPGCIGSEHARGHLEGICVGSNCTGGDDNAPGSGGIYTLFFDAETVMNALNECDLDAAGSLRKATFNGAIGWQ